MGTPHLLLIPYPSVGHVNPLMQFSHVLAKHGCNITFLNTDFNHKLPNAAGAGLDNPKGPQINFVTLPDGLGPEEDRNDPKKVIFSIKTHMPHMLPKLIQDINALHGNNKITCIVATVNMGWALEVGHKLGIKGALLWPASATSLATCDCIPKLIHDGILDSDGNAFHPHIFTSSKFLNRFDQFLNICLPTCAHFQSSCTISLHCLIQIDSKFLS